MRARLKNMAPGSGFRFLCDPDQEIRLAKIIAYADGRITARRSGPMGIEITVVKT